MILSGCSGGGKSTLLAELGRRGLAVVPEPGRRIVAEELAGSGAALPWVDPLAFARRAVAMALDDLRAAQALPGRVVFDRGLVDAAVALEHAGGAAAAVVLGSRRVAGLVFLAPPWPEIHVADPERRHAFDEAVAEYHRLARAYPALGYPVIELPKIGLARRADFVLAALGAAGRS